MWGADGWGHEHQASSCLLAKRSPLLGSRLRGRIKEHTGLFEGVAEELTHLANHLLKACNVPGIVLSSGWSLQAWRQGRGANPLEQGTSQAPDRAWCRTQVLGESSGTSSRPRQTLGFGVRMAVRAWRAVWGLVSGSRPKKPKAGLSTAPVETLRR